MDAAALHAVSLCRGLDRRAVESLLAVARPVSFLAGAELVRQGEPTRGAFLIRQGEAEARVALPAGGHLAVAALADGSVFGEMSLVERGVCSATVMAKTGVDGWFIGRDEFRALAASRDPAALAIQRALTDTLADKLSQLNDRVRAHPPQEIHPAVALPPARDPLEGATRSRKAAFDWRAFLPLLPFFEGFDAEETDELVAGASVLELPRGSWILRAGTPSSACFLVVRGAVEVLAGPDEAVRRVAIAGPGELVGYMGVLRGSPHAASARAREEACVLEFPREAFLDLYGGAGGTSVSLIHSIHLALLRAITRTNTQLTRLISHAQLEASLPRRELEAALHAQVWRPAS